MKLGSLFDGSGTAPLAAAICGIEPVWASEIEPYPIKVTTARFPNMKHLGDITRINGAEVESVDVICGGSPCQDLSTAGRQAGIHEGKRSHLFFEMTRIIKQMREATHGKYPKYVIWENVPGAFSSNNGNDFLAVLQTFAEIAENDVFIPRPATRGKSDRLAWTASGEMVGDGWSLAWRTVDAQYWGVPQRRRRIYLVTDFADERAGEILFERHRRCRNLAERGAEREGTAADAEGCAGRGNCACFMGYQGKSSWIGYSQEATPTLLGSKGITNGIPAVVYDTTQITSPQNGCNPRMGDPRHPLAANQHPPLAVCMASGQTHAEIGVNIAPTLTDDKDRFPTVYRVNGKERKYIVRRLTPTECGRLQGFPDWWTDGVEGSDSARYKMWGNGMALPNMLHVMRGIAREEKLNATGRD